MKRRSPKNRVRYMSVFPTRATESMLTAHAYVRHHLPDGSTAETHDCGPRRCLWTRSGTNRTLFRRGHLRRLRRRIPGASIAVVVSVAVLAGAVVGGRPRLEPLLGAVGSAATALGAGTRAGAQAGLGRGGCAACLDAAGGLYYEKNNAFQIESPRNQGQLVRSDTRSDMMQTIS